MRSKYGAVPTVVDGIRFASKREAAYYRELCLRLKAGDIRQLLLQPKYRLWIQPFVRNGIAKGEVINCGEYIGDFQFEESDRGYGGVTWTKVVVDVKGMKTPVYRLKKRIVEALYGIQIREV